MSWLFPKIEGADWHAIVCASFEDRCTSLAEWLSTGQASVRSASVFRIENPASKQWTEATPLVADRLLLLQNHLGATPYIRFDVNLWDSPIAAMTSASLVPDGVESVLLDMSTMPKRFFLYAFKRLMENSAIKNLVVAYSRPESYPEVVLCENALPPSSLPGFAREEASHEDQRIVVSVGFVALSVDELFEQARRSKLDFLFPFPSTVPAFRRNWALFSKLVPSELPKSTQIHQVDGLDAFEVFWRLMAWGKHFDLDLLPLGPKPHALGMAMAALRLNGTAQLIYGQPQAYNPKYSVGISRDAEGRPVVLGYCVKRAGRPLF